MAVFNLARGYWEQNHFTKSQYDVRPLGFGLGVASIPFVASVLMKKPNVFLGAALGFCILDYTYDRYNAKPMNAATWAR